MRTHATKHSLEHDGAVPQVEGSAPSLQDAFATFVRTRKKKASAESAACPKASLHVGSKSPRQSPRDERRAHLRAMFVERARSYIGVPYARKHHDPVHCTCEGCSTSGRQLHHEPLFLDCCGLVRRVARSMQAQLGFRLGPGNQAYQFDTLPVRLDRASQLQPGDLIFYSGVYYDTASKRHAFNMTHVEIFVGGPTGEGTIGSRERQKWVMEYDSFRFQSQRWRLLSYHFCSLDPWLDGCCCPQHPELWQPRRPEREQQQQQAAASGSDAFAARLTIQKCWDPSKYSIFGSKTFPWPVGMREMEP